MEAERDEGKGMMMMMMMMVTGRLSIISTTL
jgi:hypothetical protein